MTRVLTVASLGIDEPAVDLPGVPGFIESAFSPLVYGVACRCLRHAAVDGARTAMVLGTVMGDTTTADLHSRRLAAGQVHNPLLFMQATANSVLGYLAAEFGVTGPALSISAAGDPVTPLLDTAELLLAEGEWDHVLVIGVELARAARAAAAWQELAETTPGGSGPPEQDLAVALLLSAGGAPLPAVHPGRRSSLRDLLRIARGHPSRPEQTQGANRC